ncbi:hypothetical protein ASPU41_00580 [Arthrobacter sp. U41]|nr:hypothetical protein ASPU41_00580 [Arthrobacter sp. U41]
MPRSFMSVAARTPMKRKCQGSLLWPVIGCNSQGQHTTKPNWCALPFAHTAARCLAKQSLKPHAQRQSPMSVARPVWGSEWPERAEAVSAKDLRSTA